MKKIKYWDINIDKRRGNLPPEEASNWSRFAKKFDIGILDLDAFSDIMGYHDFYNLDMSISPKSLYTRNPERFSKAIRKSSLKAKKLSNKQIQQRIRNL